MQQQELRDGGYDFRQYDNVWKRVCPSLSPFPDIPPRPVINAAAPDAAMNSMPTGAAATDYPLPVGSEAMNGPAPGGMTVQEAPMGAAGRASPANTDDEHTCCLGPAAMGTLPILGGFMRSEAASFRFERALAARAPDAKSRAAMERLAREGESILRRLSATYFLIADSFPQIEKPASCGTPPCWTEGLRDLYYAEICGGVNYARAARGTTDPCLIRIFHDLGDLKGDRANTVLRLIAQSKRAKP